MSHAQCVHELCVVCVSVCECVAMYVWGGGGGGGGRLRITIFPRSLSTVLWIFMQSNTCCTLHNSYQVCTLQQQLLVFD